MPFGPARVFRSPFRIFTLELAPKLWFWAKPKPEMDSVKVLTTPITGRLTTNPSTNGVFMMCPPTLRVRNPCVVLVCPNS